MIIQDCYRHVTTGSNYPTWSTAIQISLGAKDKLGFIDGTIRKPSEDSIEYQKWRKVDFIVRSWILGSLSKDLAKTFVYCYDAKDIWEELKERFGEGNGPQVYRIQSEIVSVQQGNNSLANYFNKLKKLWDDVNRLRPLLYCQCSGCNCGLSRKLAERESSVQAIQFLMGLNEKFEGAKNQF